MSELRVLLEKRKDLREGEEIYKEFDAETGTFREITKEEREVKARDLE